MSNEFFIGKYYQPIILVTNNFSEDFLSLKICSTLSVDKSNLNMEFIYADKTASISVDQIREITLDSSKKNITQKCKVIFLMHAEKMRDVAQNSLLKILEEPEVDVLIIMVTERIEAILNTILSRTKILYSDRDIKELNINNEKILIDIINGTESLELIWKDSTLVPQNLELQCFSDHLKNSIDQKKLAKLWLFHKWEDS